ncbi:hypothetical protein NC796_22890 [Aliifodinibius sp. S!AR15-10]|nr:hypothetical protein [Aliifodinibius sp. S!AR15-10]MDR8394019.1 hypothetical protein [Aliifodinibius sp. S!AR15-10]
MNVIEKVAFLSAYSFEHIREYNIVKELLVQLIFFMPLIILLILMMYD